MTTSPQDRGAGTPGDRGATSALDVQRPQPAVWRPRAPRVRRNSGNRLLWTIVGIILLGGGVAVVLTSAGAIPVDPDTPLVWPEFLRGWEDWGSWASGAAIAAAALVAILGYLLLQAELRGRGGRELTDQILERAPDGPEGWTLVSSSALSHAFTRDLRSHPGVNRAGVLLTGTGRRPMAYLRLTVTPEADIGEVRDHVDAALSRFAMTSGSWPEVAEVTVSVAGRAPQRVH